MIRLWFVTSQDFSESYIYYIHNNLITTHLLLAKSIMYRTQLLKKFLLNELI